MDNQGEQSMSPQELNALVPDLVSPKGQALVQSMLGRAQQIQPELDNTFKLTAMQNGLDPVKDYESRVKNADTLVKKVAVHRQGGKGGYRMNNVNDMYGGRFIADTPEQKAKIIDALHELHSNNFLKLDKEEQVDHGTYHAYHMDFSKNGVKGEIQIHDPHSLFEAVVNHDIRAQYGENPPGKLGELKEKASEIGYKMPADQAQSTAQQIQAQRILQSRGGE